jgi:5-methylcytosine-specific restriction endonuclease McrA
MNDDARIVRELIATRKWGLSGKWVKVCLRANFKCEYCGCDFFASPEAYKQIEREHIVPKHRQGADDLNNLALACRTCNFCFKGRWDHQRGAYRRSEALHYRTQAVNTATDGQGESDN